MLSKNQIKTLLKQYRLIPKKHLGQNFLINQKVIQEMIKSADIKQTDVILEIGPGLGSLTQGLVKTGAKIIAIEKDKNLVKILKDRFTKANNLKIMAGDIRKWTTCRGRRPVPINNYKIIANLPYYLTAPVTRQFLESKQPPKLMVFLIQKQVAQRICAKPPKMNLLAVSVQVYAQPKIIAPVSKKSFWPQPEVDGAIIRIKPILGRRLKPATPVETHSYASLQLKKHFFKIVKAGFSHPRKQLANNLSQKLKIKKEKIQKILKKLNLDQAARAENLSIEQWIKLMHHLRLSENCHSRPVSEYGVNLGGNLKTQKNGLNTGFPPSRE